MALVSREPWLDRIRITAFQVAFEFCNLIFKSICSSFSMTVPVLPSAFFEILESAGNLRTVIVTADIHQGLYSPACASRQARCGLNV